ncbi:MAG TPA: hypothetical protein VN660_01255 [Steroidobacteraceae bacterium]|nr:hypothetical protein [Steroidobacteraceae bacterium]
MNNPRAGQPGATRLCPHCKATVLESASICPGCRHHLRFSGGKQLAEESYTALSVDGTIAHRQNADPCEYCIVLDISNERGEQVMRQVVGVGALQPGELRRLNLSVQMLPLVAQVQPRAATAPSAAAAATAPAAAARSPPGQSPPAVATGASGSVLGTNARAPGNPPAPGGPAALPPGRVATPAPTPSGLNKPSTSAPSTSAPSSLPPAPARPSLQPPGLTQSQRLRIFRKP